MDSGVFNYMLNQEYLMAEFYACASTGQGIPASLRLGGPPSIGCQKANINGLVAVCLIGYPVTNSTNYPAIRPMIAHCAAGPGCRSRC